MAPVYSGSLQPKKKAELQEIATALKISDFGTKEDLQARIKKYLEANQKKLEADPAFAGLFGRRKRSVQPQTAHPDLVPSPSPELSEDISVKMPESPKHTRSTRRVPLETVREVTPLPDAREVSMMLKNVPVSPEEISTAPLVESTPHKDAGRMVTSTPKSILRKVPGPSAAVAVDSIKKLRMGTQQRASATFSTARTVCSSSCLFSRPLHIFYQALSSSTNIWLLTAFIELLYILYVVIPWKSIEIPSSRDADQTHFYVSIPYAPLLTFQSSAFWSVLIHWSLPALVIPAVLGLVVSFNPANAPSARVPRVLPLDPLTASVVRLAAQYAYPYETLNASIEGVDVVGPRWRILNAAVGVAFAYAEAIFTAPGAYSEARTRHRAAASR
ncbi:hypothetical protein F5I97DRAFT_1817671 [Phlebopus sp. FC_14]|nr:hypothetical protein F5I97DRAFT_1817671 [Phlebopus sp. FC_14]